jgi:hypothetical protein
VYPEGPEPIITKFSVFNSLFSDGMHYQIRLTYTI